jgi:hypothetical protein
VVAHLTTLPIFIYAIKATGKKKRRKKQHEK